MKKVTLIISCLIIVIMTCACSNEKKQSNLDSEVSSAMMEINKQNVQYLYDSINVFSERMKNLTPIERKKVILECETTVRAHGKELISKYFDPIYEKYDEKEIFKSVKNIFIIKSEGKAFMNAEEEKQFDNVFSTKGGFYMSMEEGIVEEYYKTLNSIN